LESVAEEGLAVEARGDRDELDGGNGPGVRSAAVEGVEGTQATKSNAAATDFK